MHADHRSALPADAGCTPEAAATLSPAHLPLMHAIALQAIYQMAFEEAQADAREALRRARYEPKWN